MVEPSVFLTTDRLVLRRFTLDDADELLALDSDPLVRRFVEDGEPVTRDNAVEMIEHWSEYHERSDLFGFWAAIERATGRFLGWFHFRPGDGHADDEPELGYRLIASAWGRGLATEGSIALIDRGFSTGRIRRVLAETMAVNVGSRRVMEKAVPACDGEGWHAPRAHLSCRVAGSHPRRRGRRCRVRHQFRRMAGRPGLIGRLRYRRSGKWQMI
jgi:RimJ/RimL family protein N-acetyltransferase